MAGLISGQRQDMSKINNKTMETMPRGTYEHFFYIVLKVLKYF